MKNSAKAQHGVDKANFKAAKAEARATFEENRGRNTWKKAKAMAKKSWDDAHMTPAQRSAQADEQRQKQIADAQARQATAEARLKAAQGQN